MGTVRARPFDPKFVARAKPLHRGLPIAGQEMYGQSTTALVRELSHVLGAGQQLDGRMNRNAFFDPVASDLCDNAGQLQGPAGLLQRGAKRPLGTYDPDQQGGNSGCEQDTMEMTRPSRWSIWSRGPGFSLMHRPPSALVDQGAGESTKHCDPSQLPHPTSLFHLAPSDWMCPPSRLLRPGPARDFAADLLSTRWPFLDPPPPRAHPKAPTPASPWRGMGGPLGPAGASKPGRGPR